MSLTGSCVLVIGFPGEIARVFAERVVAEKGAAVRVLCDRERLAVARRWAKKLAGDVEILEGDPLKIDMGLAGNVYNRLADELTAIVSLVPSEPYGAERVPEAPKTRGREIIELALISRRLTRAVVLSDLDVAGEGGGPFTESDPGSAKGHASDAARFRFEAERVYRRFSEELPLTVIRTGLVMGEGAEGLCPVAHLFLASGEGAFDGGQHLALTDGEDLVRLVVALAGASSELAAPVLHGFCADTRLASDLHDLFGAAARAQIPGGFDLAAGARRVLSRERGSVSWSPKDLLRRCRTGPPPDDRRTRGVLDDLGIPPSRLRKDRLERLADLAAEEIVGFR